MTVWEGGGGQGTAIDDGNTYFSIFPSPPPNRSDKEWQLCTTEGPTPVFNRSGGSEGPLMAEIYIFFFPFFSSMSGISASSRGEYTFIAHPVRHDFINETRRKPTTGT